MWFFHVRCWSIIIPRNLLSSTLCNSFPLNLRFICLINCFLCDLKIIKFDFLIFRVSWFSVNHSWTRANSAFTVDSSSCIFFPRMFILRWWRKRNRRQFPWFWSPFLRWNVVQNGGVYCKQILASATSFNAWFQQTRFPYLHLELANLRREIIDYSTSLEARAAEGFPTICTFMANSKQNLSMALGASPLPGLFLVPSSLVNTQETVSPAGVQWLVLLNITIIEINESDGEFSAR